MPFPQVAITFEEKDIKRCCQRWQLLEVTPWELFCFFHSQHQSESWKQSNILQSLWFLACPAPTLREHELCLLKSFIPYPIPPRPIPSTTVVPGGEDTAGGSCLSGAVRMTEPVQGCKVTGCAHRMLWLLFAPSGLNFHSDWRGPGYKIMDPAPFSLHGDSVKAETWGECCWL